ncbi:MAG: HEAT repeat domain-containing protein [Ilumatobacteraceae bacterium]
MSLERRIDVIRAGFSGDVDRARGALRDADEMVRVSALRALDRAGALDDADLTRAVSDDSHEVRRAAVQLSATRRVDIAPLVNDPDLFVAEMAAWALGERPDPTDAELETLIHNATTHGEAIVREACAAALGSIGDPRGLPAILAACNDKPAVRRRAVLALAPFEGPEVDAALTAALEDRDWQVRQNAEDLVNPRLTPRD